MRKRRNIKKRRTSYSEIFINFSVTTVLFFIAFFFFVVPKVKLNEPINKVVNINSIYNNEGITIEDIFGNKMIFKTISNIDTSKNSINKLDYIYKDNFFSFRIKQNIIVKDIESPKIILNGDKEEYFCPNSKYKEQGYKAYDNVDKDITKSVKVKKYSDKIVYSVTDSSGNKSEVTRFIKKGDDEKPVITLNGDKDIFIPLGGEYIDEGISAIDNCDQDITSKVKVTDNIDNTKVGDYKIEYQVKDNSNNKSTITRNIKVREPLEPNTIYLTFDDGPRDGTTNKILDILKEKDVKATFFVTSNGSDDLIRRAYNEGHSLGIHTSSHRYDLIYASIDNYYNDLNIVENRIFNITGKKTNLIRFPGGSSNTISKKYSQGIMSTLTKDVISKNYQYYDWNIDSTDAVYNSSKNDIYNNVINNISKDKYNIILMHDTKNKTVEVLPMIIDYAKSNGYNFKTLTSNTIPMRQKVNN